MSVMYLMQFSLHFYS